jgi:DNA polymerase III epsilon subunit-like protein
MLTFQELRDKCRHNLDEILALCIGEYKDFDVDFLKEEFAIIKSEINNDYSHQDLVNAYFSYICELEHKKVIYPNSLINYGRYLARVNYFKWRYPLIINIQEYVLNSNGKLKKYSRNISISKNLEIILLVDPLSKK